MTGIIDSNGRVIITFDSQYEQLLAPDNKKYLPCDQCGKIEAVELNVVSHLCYGCYANQHLFKDWEEE